MTTKIPSAPSTALVERHARHIEETLTLTQKTAEMLRSLAAQRDALETEVWACRHALKEGENEAKRAHIPDSLPIDQIPGLPVRIQTACRHAKDPEYKTAGDLRRAPDYELLRIPNLGLVSVSMMRDILGR